jgi:hypothetical protein
MIRCGMVDPLDIKLGNRPLRYESNGAESPMSPMNILDMPIEWQQRSANTFSMPMPIRKTRYSLWLKKRNLPAAAATVLARAASVKETATVSTKAAMMGASISKHL